MSTAHSHPLPPGTLVRVKNPLGYELPYELEGREIAIVPLADDFDPADPVYEYWDGTEAPDGHPWYITPDHFDVIRLPGAEEATDA